MRGSLWKCTSIQCKLAADDEARALEIHNSLLLDLRVELQDNRGRNTYVDFTRERPLEPAAELDQAQDVAAASEPQPARPKEIQVIEEAVANQLPEHEEAIIPEDNPCCDPHH